MSLQDDANRMADEIRAKREANKKAQELKGKAADEALKRQQQVEEDKREGMI